jgi:hypothetical protein
MIRFSGNDDPRYALLRTDTWTDHEGEIRLCTRKLLNQSTDFTMYTAFNDTGYRYTKYRAECFTEYNRIPR